jgi:Uma2 family endonuclease
MTAMPWPDHLLTLDEWDALPEDDSHRYELVEGVLHATPRALPLHQRAAVRLTTALDDQLPDDLTALSDTEVVLDPRWPPTVRAPDVLVVRTEVAEANPPRFQAADPLLVVEIVSPGSRTTDRYTKLVEYAKAGIPRYWIVDIDKPVSLRTHVLVGGEYELIAKHSGTAALDSPAPVTIDLDALVTRRA